MRRLLSPLFAVAVSGFVWFGAVEPVLACEPGSGSDAVYFADWLAIAPTTQDDAIADLTAELEGRVIIQSGESVNPVRVESPADGHDATPLLAALALAAPVFTAASVGIVALRNRRR